MNLYNKIFLILLFFSLIPLVATEPQIAFETKKKSPKKAPLAQPKPSAKPEKPEKKSDTNSSKKKKKKKQSRLFRNMSYEELVEAKNQHVATKNYDVVLRYLEKIMPLCNDLNELHDLMLEMADILFEQRDFEKAGKMYQEFATLYPGSQKIEYAKYKTIDCNFYQISDAERDQSKTKETIELAEGFLQQTYTTYTTQVKDIYSKCQERLLESELSICNFYIHRGSLSAAQKRLDLARNSLVPTYPQSEASILSLECTVAELQKKPELFTQKKLELAQKFPDFAQQLEDAKTAPTKLAHRF